ncbi:MAG: HDIG domain-containing protein [Nitrospirae bacterium]|nr:HDIG domain-containing protein [Nitrospirota bacterium]
MKSLKTDNAEINKHHLITKGSFIRLSLLMLFSGLIGATILFGRGFISGTATEVSHEAAAGVVLVIGLLLIIFYKDLKRYTPTIEKDYKTIILVGILLTTNFILGEVFYFIFKLFTLWLGNIDPMLPIYVIPLATGSMLAALLIDIHTAILLTIVSSLIAGLWLNDPVYPIFNFAAGITAAFGVIRCKRRSAIWRGGLYVSMVCVFTSMILILYRGHLPGPETMVIIGFSFLNGMLVAILVSALLPVGEKFFKLITDISLLELLDLNQPLLQELLAEAPSTYHHSIVVGNLVESAAEAVGVNPLMARVSAYYHDIGKIKMPEYFIENQTGLVSRHENMSPRMSALVLISHVKEGVELAKKYNLPKAIIDIIQQHHGTSIQTYFWQKAREQHEADKTLPPSTEDDFRYPGPKPRTNVAALIHMADAVEAASRTLTEPTPEKISALIDRIVNNRIIDGQLDECELTLKDIREIKTHFVFILSSMFHKRINYPGFEIENEDTDKKPAAAPEAGH